LDGITCDKRANPHLVGGGADLAGIAFRPRSKSGLKRLLNSAIATTKEETMKKKLLLTVSCFALVMSVAAYGQLLGGHRTESDAVKKALQQADLKDVSVSDDANKNTIALSGTLHSEDAKKRAADVAKSAAPNRQIANEISVEPVGGESQARAMASNLDDGIESNYKAALLSKGLDKESIHYKAKNGVLVLTGSVNSAQQREEASHLASKVPNVRQVVNQLDVRR